VARWQSRQLPEFHRPGLRTQLQLWFFLLVSALLLGIILFRR
jgi:hypothetical protein